MNADVHTLAGAYVLHAVDESERAAFEQHLAGCPECTAEVAELRATAVRLVDAAAVTPPATLRERVLAQAARTRQVAPLPRHAEPAGPAPTRRLRRLFALAAAVVLLAGAVGTATYVVGERRLGVERARAAEISRVLSAPDATVVLRDVEGGGRITTVYSRGQDRAVVVLADLPTLTAARSYQLWFQHGPKMVNAGVLAAGTNGDTRILTGLDGAEGLGVTAEPAGGSVTPTLPPVALLPLA